MNNKVNKGLKKIISNNELKIFKLAVLNASDHIVITNPDGIILYANKAVKKITGYSNKEVIGKKAGSKELWGGMMSKILYQKLWKTIKTDKKAYTGTLNNKTKNGKKYFALANISPILNNKNEVEYFVGIERDISDQIYLNKEKEKLDLFFDLSIDMLCLANTKGYFTKISPSFISTLGWSQKELLEKPFEYFIHPEDKQKTLKEIKNLAKGMPTINFKNRYMKKDGSYIWLSWTATPRPDGTLFAIAHDITHDHLVDMAKTEFVSLASHQLRTPLSAISWYAEMILAGDVGKLNKELREYLQEIYDSNRRMINLVNSLLNVSRIEIGTFAIDSEKVNLKELTESVINELRPNIKMKKIILDKKISPKVPKEYIGDRKLLNMIFQNLLSNSIKYSPDKSKVELKILIKNKKLCITVKDNGFGIPKKDHPKIFKKLFRADNVKEKDTDGTGLGLYIIKAIIEQSQGKIWFKSIEKKGTTFFIELPITGMKKKEGSKPLS